MNWLDRLRSPNLTILKLEAPVSPPEPVTPPDQTPIRNEPRFPYRRQYQSAISTNLTGDWNPGLTSANWEIRGSLRPTKARARQALRDDPHARLLVQRVEENVVGANGIRLQCKSGDLELDQLIETKFAEWAECCDIKERDSWVDLQRLAIRHFLCDGETIFRVHTAPENRFGIQLEQINCDWLDDTYNSWFSTGTRIILGIELDPINKVTGYHVRVPLHEMMFVGQTSTERMRIPASQILHIFKPEQCNQVRGMSLIGPGLYRLRMLFGYLDAHVTRARIEAAKQAFVIPPAPDLANVDPKEKPQIDEVQAGQVTELPPGYDVKVFDPTSPNPNAGEFEKDGLRGFGATVGLVGPVLHGNLTEANYSSMRSGQQINGAVYRNLQSFLIRKLLKPVFCRWLEAAWISGALSMGKRPVTLDQLEQIEKTATWQGPVEEWVDPENKIKATEMELNLGLTTHSLEAAKRGLDLEELWRQKVKDIELARKLGLKISGLTMEEGGKSNAGNTAKDQNPAGNPDPDAASESETEPESEYLA